MTKLTEAEQVRSLAREEAKNLLDVASATATALQASTAKDISTIQNDIKEINAKLDGRFVQKEDFDAFSVTSAKQRNDHEDRIRFLERYGFMIIGAVVLAEVVIGWYVAIHK